MGGGPIHLVSVNSALIQIERDGPAISILTLNRPDKRNAMSIALMEEFCRAVDSISQDETQRVLVLHGAGTVFCAGLDLKEGTEPANAEKSAHLVAKVMLTMHQARPVTIAAVHGAAVAGGAGLMSVCDFVVAAEDAQIGYPEVRRGLVAGIVMTFLRRQCRERDVRELLLTGELVTAARAREMGLVSRVVAASEVMNEARRIADAVIEGGPDALRRSKKFLDELWPTTVTHDIERALSHHMLARTSEEAKEGMAAFLEKRKPRWSR